MADIELARERGRELIREAEGQRLARLAGSHGPKRVGEGGISVRWGLAGDDGAVADVLQLNGMPRWVAFEERFIVAEKDGKLLGAVRYVTESNRLILGLLVVDPWEGERRTAKALYSGALELVRDLGATEVVAAPLRGTSYPEEAGYRRAGRGWRISVPAGEPEGGTGFWRALLHLWGTKAALPFYRAHR